MHNLSHQAANNVESAGSLRGWLPAKERGKKKGKRDVIL